MKSWCNAGTADTAKPGKAVIQKNFAAPSATDYWKYFQSINRLAPTREYEL